MIGQTSPKLRPRAFPKKRPKMAKIEARSFKILPKFPKMITRALPKKKPKLTAAATPSILALNSSKAPASGDSGRLAVLKKDGHLAHGCRIINRGHTSVDKPSTTCQNTESQTRYTRAQTHMRKHTGTQPCGNRWITRMAQGDVVSREGVDDRHHPPTPPDHTPCDQAAVRVYRFLSSAQIIFVMEILRGQKQTCGHKRIATPLTAK